MRSRNLPTHPFFQNPMWRSPVSFFDTYLPGAYSPSEWDEEEESGGRAASCPVDIHETEDEIQIEAEMPGFKKEEIDVMVESGVLTIRAERTRTVGGDGSEAQSERREGTQHVRERRRRRMVRSFTLPSGIEEGQVSATLSDGVLEIRLPKREETRSRKIRVD